jgi:sugar phosphate isomerase/epimerase
MWAQQPRFETDMAHFRRLVASYGFDAIEVSHSTDDDGLATLMGDGEVPLTSLHAPTPRRKLVDGRTNGDANLASTDEDERRLAVEETQRTVDFAARGGLSKVVVHLGGVGNYMSEPERALRRLVETGETDVETLQRDRGDLRALRAAGDGPALEAARLSLRVLVEYAGRRGVALGLESRLHYHVIHHPDEAL